MRPRPHSPSHGVRAVAAAVPATGRRADHGRAGRRIVAAGLAGLAALLLAGGASAKDAKGASKPIDTFLKSFRKCDYAGRDSAFIAFEDALARKFKNPHGFKGPSGVDGSITVPGYPFVSTIEAVSHGDHTLVSVGLTGKFHGTPVKMIEFSFGNENGISAATLVFDATRQAVVDKFGADIAKGERKGRAEEQSGKGAGYSAIIPPDNPGRISCDWST